MPNAIRNADNMELAQAYITWDNKPGSFAKAAENFGQAYEASRPLMYSKAAIANRFQNIDVNTSVRDTTSSLDYQWFRPGEVVPRHFRDIIAACMGAYQKVPVIKQVIDLMGDFTAQGITLVHEDPTIQNFYNEWFRRVDGLGRTERIANLLYRCGNVIIKRSDAVLNTDAINQWKKTVADTDLEYEDETMPGPYEIPYQYMTLNPIIIEVLGEHVAAFTGKVHYVLNIPMPFYNSLSLPLASFDPSILTEGLPNDIKTAMDNKERYLLLDSDKLVTLFYKKDDWDVWAYPMLYSLLDEVILLQKLKQADMTALDGLISHIRVWKLGSLEHKIFPTNAAITKLSNILLNHLAGGAMDLVWGPDLELTQTSTDISKCLGSEKYEYCMNTIHGGLGIPAAIGRSKGSMTDNFMSIRVLLERLVYGRSVVTRFWEGEIRRVQHAMGFKTPARIMYDNIILNDETAEKALWLQALDRNIVPVQAVQERFGRIPEIDNLLLMREKQARDNGKMVNKVSPYEDAEPDLSLTKIYAQGGLVMPSELPDKFDLDLKKPSADHQEIKDNMFPEPPPPAEKASKPKGVAGEGRPSGSGDKSKRKQRIPKPSSKAEEFMTLTNQGIFMQGAIAQIVDPYYLNKFNKTSIGDLTPTEGSELTKFKFNLLLNTKADDVPRPDVVMDMMERSLKVYDIEADYTKLCRAFQQKLDRKLNDDDLTNIKAYIYALVKGLENE